MTGKADVTFARNPDVVFRVVAGERLLVPVRGEAARTRRLFTLNPLGATVWELLENDSSLDELCGELQKRHPNTAPERIRADTERYLTDLSVARLIVASGRNSGHDM
jgi:hypothetical protein